MRVNIIGNGPSVSLYKDDIENKNIICNIPNVKVSKVFASVMVDFKMMRALNEGKLNNDKYEWVLGFRPDKYREENPSFKMKYAGNVKDYYTRIPDYAGGPTNFNCGHVATHYACTKIKPTEIHMYGFDSLFDHTITSLTDNHLEANRLPQNVDRLTKIWREVWINLFREFPRITFVVHHLHSDMKINIPKNVKIIVGE